MTTVCYLVFACSQISLETLSLGKETCALKYNLHYLHRHIKHGMGNEKNTPGSMGSLKTSAN